MKIGVVDYKAGNLKSVETALRHLGADFFISDQPEELSKAAKMIFPGVGEASSAMDVLNKSGIGQCIKDFAESGKSLLGICLGSQIILDHSEENNTDCLGIIPGNVIRFPSDSGLKIPQIGWNTIRHNDSPLFKDIPQNQSFYFVHSYYVKPENDSDIAAISDYGIDFCAAVNKKNVWATQFHPEKSGEWGLKLLNNFICMD